jgi:hypothetical protein
MALAIAAGSYFFLSRPDRKTPEAVRVQKNEPRRALEFANYEFEDGLGNPASKTEYPLDETGAGIAVSEVFYAGADRRIKITRERFESGTAHGYYEYKLELDGRDITPDGFRTIEGADCSLQKLKFLFIPEFSVVKISRPWEESWITPTMAVKTVYRLAGGNLKAVSTSQLKETCDVSGLF